jgi:hypothetical protein
VPDLPGLRAIGTPPDDADHTACSVNDAAGIVA